MKIFNAKPQSTPGAPGNSKPDFSWRNSAPRAARPGNFQPSTFNLQPAQRGVALIITLILLAVVTVMAVAFLATSTRERGAVATATDTAGARLAADAALAQAEAQIMANVLATTNPYNFGLLVSTNYVNSFGFQTGIANPTNVNYWYANGNSLNNPGDIEQNIANLLYSPRAPVFVPTNPPGNYSPNNSYDFRYYLDLNRNGVDDPNVNDPNFISEINSAGNLITNIGDPEWIGVLDHPDQPHGPNNRFIARYAFVAVPIGNALDLNAIHNQARADEANGLIATANDTFMRNQGVGSWEINLAGFLADLNTNQWGQIVGSGASAPPGSANWYQYNEPSTINFGNAFDDARALLAYRYDNNFANLPNANSLFFNSAMLQDDDIDEYSDGPLQVTTPSIDESMPANQDVTSLPWAGADNTNHFFDMQELFANPNNTFPNFTNRLLIADADTNSTYDRYTFYRLLAELGTDSAPEQNKMNLNYDNLDPYVTNGVVYPPSETNLMAWTALGFFTNAADRMLRAYSQDWLARDPSNYVATYFMTTNIGTVNFPTNVPVSFGITDIPVLVSNQFVYSSAINRVLQLAANIYDATTYRYYDNSLPLTPLPTVFQPIFSVINGNVYISSFSEVTNTDVLANPLLNLDYGTNVLTTLQNNPSDLVFGVPLIIGAKKGFPNFNEFAMENAFQLTRKLQVTRSSTNQTIAPVSSYQVNQMFNLSVTNQLGVECWNSYTNNYTRPVDIYVTNYLSVELTNDENLQPVSANFVLSGFLQINSTSYNNNGWPGYNLAGNAVLLAPDSFQIPLTNNVAFIPDSMYRFNVGGLPFLTTNLALPFETNVVKYPQPIWSLMVTNNLQVIMVDANSGRIIDYVQLRGPNSSRTNLNAEIASEWDKNNYTNAYDGLWDTNLDNQGMPYGLDNQIGISLGSHGLGSAPNGWSQTDLTTVHNEIDGFRAFFHYPNSLYNDVGSSNAITAANITNAMQVPYTPTATTYQHITWQANDPLVHYIAGDLNTPAGNGIDANPNWPGNIGQLNDRYMPWGGNPLLTGADQNPYNLALKDPLVRSSDDWDFPTYKLPTVGWLGRVHRGTPWQTVYMKSAQPSLAYWATNWTGNLNLFDAYNSSPGADWQLFDLFTTAPNDNATRGQLSVNVGANDPNNPQAGLAAWSALFSGVEVLSNSAADTAIQTNVIVEHANSIADYSAFPINPAGPAGVSSALGQIVTNINFFRARFTNADGLVGSFEHAGDILDVPQLTDQSPFLHLSNFVNSAWVDDPIQKINGISDEMYEWLPQQTMSLLHASGTPQSPMRYVIYCYGQTLKPAPNGIVTGGTLFGICTNYQVVAEAATRAVVQFGSTRTNTVDLNRSPAVIATNINNNAMIESFNVLPPN